MNVDFMRGQIIGLGFLLLGLTSCDNLGKQEKKEQEIPKALQEKSSSSEIFSKRRYDDLVESLYNELAEKTPGLMKLENEIDDLSESKDDSLELFEKYDSKNQSYFNSADRHVAQIKDSVLRDKLKILIATSLTKYNSSVSPHTEILKSIGTKELVLNDLHTIVKIVSTLPVIEKYQKDNLPKTTPLEGYSKQLDNTIKYADTVVKEINDMPVNQPISGFPILSIISRVCLLFIRF